MLSFFGCARTDARFAEVVDVLESKLDQEGRVVVERPHRRLGQLAMCAKGEPSEPATRRYREIEANLAA